MREDYQVPRRLGCYELRRCLGRGGMGEVWLAKKDGMTKPCVVKVLLPKYARDPEYRRRFLREAKMLNLVQHGRIVSIMDWGESQGWLYIVMQYVDGVDVGTFCRALARDGQTVPLRVATYVTGEVLEALRHAHERGWDGEPNTIIHQDITPGNVLISSDGEIFVTDFGLAHFQSELSGEIFGTLDFMAPEQAKGQVYIQSDLYAVGCLLFFMLTGRAPRKVKNVYELELASLDPTSLDIGRTDVPEPVERLLALCLAPRPEDRIQSARDCTEVFHSSGLNTREAIVTAALYAKHVGVPCTGLSGVVPAARFWVGSNANADGGTLWGPVEATEEDEPAVVSPPITPEPTVVLTPPTVDPPAEPSPTALHTEPTPAAVSGELNGSEPPSAGTTNEPVAGLWNPWWKAPGDADDNSLDETVTRQWVEADAPRLLRGPARRAAAAVLADLLAAPPATATERLPPPFTGALAGDEARPRVPKIHVEGAGPRATEPRVDEARAPEDRTAELCVDETPVSEARTAEERTSEPGVVEPDLPEDRVAGRPVRTQGDPSAAGVRGARAATARVPPPTAGVPPMAWLAKAWLAAALLVGLGFAMGFVFRSNEPEAQAKQAPGPAHAADQPSPGLSSPPDPEVSANVRPLP